MTRGAPLPSAVGARAAGLLALLAPIGSIGCADPAPTYVAPDASAWSLRPTRWVPADAGSAGYALVSNSLSNSISVLDLTAGTTLATIPVGVVPLTENGPHHIAFDPREGTLFTPLSFPPAAIPAGPHAAHGSSQRAGTLVKRAASDFRLLGRVDVDANPGDLVLSPDGRRAFISHYDLRRAQANAGDREAQRSNLVVVDTRTMEVTHRIPVCVAAHGMTISPDGSRVYMACYGDDAMGVVTFRGAQPEVQVIPIRTLPLNPTSPTYGPYAITPSPDGSTVWLGCTPPSLSSGNRGLFIAFDTASMRFDAARAFTNLIGTPYFGAYTPDGATLIVPLQGRDAIARIALGPTPRVLAQTAVRAEDCVLPHQLSVGPDGLYYLVCEGVHDRIRQDPGTVLALRPDDLSVVRRFDVGAFPDAITFTGALR